ncbi:hypothetical protein B0H13DRAFT_2670683, partial [Mycena leptocephala]
MTESLSEVEIHQQLEISRYLVLIPFSILVFDYALTFEEEVTRYWATGLTWGTALFYINRYSALIGTIPILVELQLTTIDPNKMVVQGFSTLPALFVLLSQILVAAMLIMRTYALYGRSKIILAFMLSVTFAAIGFAVYILLAGNNQDSLDPHLKAIGCPTPSPHDSDIRTAAAWSGMLIFDVMIFLLTAYKALKYATRSRSLFSVLVRDGSLYFIIMIAANAANIGTYTMGGPIISGSATTVVNALSSVMITRLMLNLRDPHILRLSQRTRTIAATTRWESQAPMTTLMDPYLDTEIPMDSMWIHEVRGEGQRVWQLCNGNAQSMTRSITFMNETMYCSRGASSRLLFIG